MEFNPKRIIWHHSADVSSSPQFDKIDEYHKTRGFPISSLGFYVGYHYLIEHDGSIRKAREESEIGAHDAGENFNSIGVCFAGDFNIDFPTQEQAASAALLIREICERHTIPITHIEPHRWDDTTECPGKNVEDNWLIKVYLSRFEDPERVQFLQTARKYNFI